MATLAAESSGFDTDDESFAAFDRSLQEIGDVGGLDRKPGDRSLSYLEQEDSDLLDILRLYWTDIHVKVQDQPVVKVYMSALWKMAGEYKRLADSMDTIRQSIEDLGTDAELTNERARGRDNFTTLATEGWKLLNAVADSLYKIQGLINKMEDKDRGSEDIFDMYNQGG